ncbi:hypothetical protein AGMMS50222_01360 [Endomicrobiia bacterium]|nr:hypothetical protein AGMMS49531_03690 [Endomicrobiia bacterium]GHT70831.1 hypothetical protein AGMMS49950_06460 [Endomicrobiia bacterium]GHT73598.1 hypothetical protein AGMMS50222_01360 [Endomicrobiia bacterium]
MGAVYYANYLTFLKEAEQSSLEKRVLNINQLKRERVCLPAIYVECRYLSPAKYGDMLTIETKIPKVTVASITCSYEIKCDSRILVTEKTKHPFVNKY